VREVLGSIFVGPCMKSSRGYVSVSSRGYVSVNEYVCVDRCA